MKCGFTEVKNQTQVGDDDEGNIIMNELKYLTTLPVIKSSFQPHYSLWND